MIRYVCGFIISTDLKKVALIEKNRPKWQQGYLNGIGGKIENSESIYDAVAREFQEETGCNTNTNDWIYFDSIINNEFELYFLYFISNKIYDVLTITDEIVNVYEIDNLQEYKLINGIYDVILNIVKYNISFNIS